MKIAYYLQIQNLLDIEIQDLLKYLYACKKYDSSISAHDISNRSSREHALLIAYTSNDKITIDLFSYNSLAELGKEGHELISAPDKYEFFEQLTVGKFKYYK